MPALTVNEEFLETNVLIAAYLSPGEASSYQCRYVLMMKNGIKMIM